jgi:hypothetical protein
MVAPTALSDGSCIATIWSSTLRQADRPDLNLPKEQDQLIRRVARANPNTVVVVTTGGVTKTSNWEEDVPAILHAWYPGQEQGNAIADLLFGDVNPSGKLPATVPADESQVPPIDLDQVAEHPEGVFVGYRGFQQRGDTPSYPFGYGLSYSTFRYRGLRVDDGRPGEPQGDITVSFDLRNRSNRAGAEVAQVYIGRLPTRAVATPPRQLAGFEKARRSGAPAGHRHHPAPLAVVLGHRVPALGDPCGAAPGVRRRVLRGHRARRHHHRPLSASRCPGPGGEVGGQATGQLEFAAGVVGARAFDAPGHSFPRAKPVLRRAALGRTTVDRLGGCCRNGDRARRCPLNVGAGSA